MIQSSAFESSVIASGSNHTRFWFIEHDVPGRQRNCAGFFFPLNIIHLFQDNALSPSSPVLTRMALIIGQIKILPSPCRPVWLAFTIA